MPLRPTPCASHLTTTAALGLMCVIAACSQPGKEPATRADTTLASDGANHDAMDAEASGGDAATDALDPDAAPPPKCTSLWTAMGKPSFMPPAFSARNAGPGGGVIACGHRWGIKPGYSPHRMPGIEYAIASAKGKIKQHLLLSVAPNGGGIMRCPQFVKGGGRMAWVEVNRTAKVGGELSVRSLTIRLDDKGKVIAQRFLPDAVGENVGLHVLPSGGLVGVASRDSSQPGPSTTWMFAGKLPSLAMTQGPAMLSPTGISPLATTIAPDGGLYVQGYALQGKTSKATRLIRLRPDGAVSWIAEVDANGSLVVPTMSLAHGGGVAIVGGLCDCLVSYEMYELGDRQLVFEHISASGEVLHKRPLPLVAGALVSVFSFARNSQGYLLLSTVVWPAPGKTQRTWTNSEGRFLLWQLDKQGEVVWRRFVGGSDNQGHPVVDVPRLRVDFSVVTGALPTGDDHIILVGRRSANDKSEPALGRPWFRRLGPRGEPDCAAKDLCLGVDTVKFCDDDDPCTIDTCQPSVGCVHTARPFGSWCGGDIPRNFLDPYLPQEEDAPSYKTCAYPWNVVDPKKGVCKPLSPGFIAGIPYGD